MAQVMAGTGYKGRYRLTDITEAGYEADVFLAWMRGQGTAVDPFTGEELYFHGDVVRFIHEQAEKK